jgi:hypothetical protein
MLGLVDHADALSTFSTAQDAAVARDVGTLLGSANGNLGKTAYQSLPDLIAMHADNAGLFTANWYDEIDPTSSFRAKPMFDIPPEQVTKAIDWALYAPGEEPPIIRLTGSSQRLVRQASRETVVNNAAKEGVRWARYAKPTACAFCRLLATRGAGDPNQKWLYHSEKSAGGEGHSYHDHCECVPVAVRAGAIWTPPEYAQGWEQQYTDATAATKRGKGYFKRVVAHMRANEPKPEPEEQPVEKAVEPTPITPAPSAEEAAQAAAKQAALKELDAAKDWREVQKVAKKILPDTTINLGGVRGGLTPETGQVPDTQLSRDVVKAVDDVLTAHPEMSLEQLNFRQLTGKDNVYAQASNYVRLNARMITMNRRFTDLPGLYQNSWNESVRTGFHHPGADSPAYNTIVHEMGHVMEDIAAKNGVDIDGATLQTALVDYFRATRGATAVDTPGAYRQWLLDGVSGYSRADPKSVDSVALNVPEALAEAFADVFINGDNAQEPSKVINKVLTDALSGKSYFDERLGGGPETTAVAA